MNITCKGNAILCALLAALALTLPASAANAPERTSPVMLAPQDAGSHDSYMQGEGSQFYPERLVSRAELAQMLVRVVADAPDTVSAFFDVPDDAWYASAVHTAAGLGLMNGEDGLFRPNDPATRAECAAALVWMLPYDAWTRCAFPDVPEDYWAYHAISRTAGYGLFQGDNDGNFRPESGLKRCEAVAVFNRLMGRRPDRPFITGLGFFRFFSDVPTGHWAYWDIVEASVSHTCAADPSGVESWSSAQVEYDTPPQPVDGPRRIDGRLYWVVDGQYLKNQSLGAFYFDAQGRYTTGDAELDTQLNNIVEQLTNDSMTRDEKLRALYNYVRDNFTYLKRPLISKGQTGWEAGYAKYFLANGKGNCYNYAATYCLLARELGLPAYTVVGSALNSPHGWVEIPLDGATYMFDTQLDWRYLHYWNKPGYDFFKMPVTSPIIEYIR